MLFMILVLINQSNENNPVYNDSEMKG